MTATAPRGKTPLADRGYVVGARVGSETTAHRLGTIVAIDASRRILVRWDDETETVVSWLEIAPLGPGYLAEAS